MTDHISGFIVVLDRDYREDDVERILDAIRMIRGVTSVVPHVSEVADMIAQERATTEVWGKVLRAMKGS